MKHAFLALAAVLLLSGVATAQASPPKPLPNPDRPARTPIFHSTGGASISANRVCPTLRAVAHRGNRSVGLRVANLRTGKTVCGLNTHARRSLASNNKLFTVATALDRLGTDHKFRTRVFADGKVRNGTLTGSLYLKGGGDPSFGTGDFVDAYLAGVGSEVEKLAAQVKRAGIRRVTGRVYADDTVFDQLRGVADSGYATSPWIGPLSGLSFNAGYTSASLSSFSSDPAKLAARTLVRELRSRGVKVQTRIAKRQTPRAAMKSLVARQISPDMTWMARITNLKSVNFWAETLLKDLGAQVRSAGTTTEGVKVVRRTMARYGVEVWPIDGSGLTYGNRSTAGDVVKLLIKARRQPWGDALLASLPTAGVDGTLDNRMRGSAAQRRCHAKTGTLTGVSALSGYCFNKSGRRYAFSILMNDVTNLDAAHRAQDRIAAIIARL
ncbi:MAG: D-alanyl-D-alanine carboxypeptidase/D-alanyl-D-alanine-endopeptidase [Solirubrobacterales bacterium]|nr:D-alanyl-D-alanine carboxypeptidase/D-alanyl-D-alanine-endopeptidase [Solirubrobacterales bacterium]